MKPNDVPKMSKIDVFTQNFVEISKRSFEGHFRVIASLEAFEVFFLLFFQIGSIM